MNTIEQRLNYLEKRVADLERRLGAPSPNLPYMPTPVEPIDWSRIRIGDTKCSQCGVDWKGVMGYNCPHSTCPVQPKVTC